MGRTFGFITVCHKGELEIKFLLLMMSLKRHLKCNYKLFVGVPSPPEEWDGNLSSEVQDEIKKMNIFPFFFKNEFGKSFSHANKIYCLSAPIETDKVIFLDTDMLMLRDFTDSADFDAD